MTTAAAAFAAPPELAGRVVEPGHPRYRLLRSTYTRVGSPAAVVLARDARDAAAALAAAQDQGLALTVRSGGHAMSGRSTNDGGVVLDLSGMNGVEVLDRAAGLVRLGPGARWGAVAERLARDGLAISSGDHGNVAVGGLATGGGIGWLVRRYGLTVDNVRAAEVVLADGTQVRADERRHRDLFWAVRGAGAGVGVVTSVEIEAMPLRRIGVVEMAFEAKADGKALVRWAAAMAASPREVTTGAFLARDGSRAVLVVTAAVAADDPEAVRAALRPLLSGPRPLQAKARMAPYTALVSTAHEHRNAGQQRASSTSALLPEMTPEAARALMRAARVLPGAMVHLRWIGGAPNDVAADATAFAHRDAKVFASPLFPPPGTWDDLRRAWEPVWAHGPGSYVNFESTTGADAFDRSYPGATGARVKELWRRYDPGGVFRPLPI
ncbi:FAD-binding oxidoreductase [Actinomadura macrotermitis]|uniref:FAD-binding PCMH-type domain-containing protein n=1 Tax=Actinomadura macrotermitis TaxID=2585200 RepID=A0A7K0C2T9_9ACTN|nr:FAD-binding oxidoreductase [Actinomadura macrotermitis]MQY07797.1 hypothetical protein [Actinomadura macrotermitis]